MEEVIKLFGAVASLVAIYKVVVDVVLARSTRRRDEYKFTKKYVSSLFDSKEHLYTLEKGFLALTGKTYSVAEIKILLAQSSPSISINLRSDSGSFIQFDQELNEYVWKEKYAKEGARARVGNWFLFWYVVTASLAFFPFYFKSILALSGAPVTIFSLSFLVIAISCLIQHFNVSSAKTFMDNVTYPEPNGID